MTHTSKNVCIINGGGEEISAACARKMAQAGYKILIAHPEGTSVKDLAEEIKASGGIVEYLSGDFSRQEDAETLVKHTEETLGTPTVLINYCCEDKGDSFSYIDPQKWESTAAKEWQRCFLTCKEAIPKMTEAGGGSIINITSLSSIRGLPQQGAYAAVQGGIVSFTYYLASEYASGDIRANCIVTGIIKTEKYKTTRLQKEPEYERKILRHIPMGRLGKPEEIANLANFLAGEESSYITGAVIPVDGGYSIL